MAYESLNQMYDNILDPIRGWWDERQLSKVVEIASGTVNAGMVGHLNSNGKFALGTGTYGAAANWLPLFARNSGSDNDVRGVEGNLSGVSGTPLGEAPDQGISTLVGAAAYELASTAYDTTGTWAIGDTISAVADSGEIKDSTTASSYGIGYCTAVPASNYRGTSVVTFITHIFHV